MTKKEREMLQGIVNEITRYRDLADDAFKFLQARNKEVTGTAWCSAEMNYKDLLKAGEDYTYKYQLYVSSEAKRDVIGHLGSKLADLNFWK